jgi:transposase
MKLLAIGSCDVVVGRNYDTVGKVFDQLGTARATLLTHVSCDGTQWIHSLVGERAPAAIICLDLLPHRALGDHGAGQP